MFDSPDLERQAAAVRRDAVQIVSDGNGPLMKLLGVLSWAAHLHDIVVRLMLTTIQTNWELDTPPDLVLREIVRMSQQSDPPNMHDMAMLGEEVVLKFMRLLAAQQTQLEQEMGDVDVLSGGEAGPSPGLGGVRAGAEGDAVEEGGESGGGDRGEAGEAV